MIAAASSCFGRQRLLVTSIVLFTFGTALCAVAHDFAVMLVGRCVQGIGGGGIIAMTQVIFCDMVPLRQRPHYFSMVLGSWSIGSIIGPVLGGSLVERASWRWCFHINFPFCVVGLVAALCFVRSDADDNSDLPLAERLRHMDWTGALLFVGGMTTLLVGISWGGTQYAWASAATLGPIVAGVLGIAIFVRWQMHAQPYSMLPASLLRNLSSAAAFYCALINGLVVSLPCRLLKQPLIVDRRLALHSPLLCSLLPDVGAWLLACPRRHRSLSRSLPARPWLRRCGRSHFAPRPLSLGDLARLGRHGCRVRPVHLV